MHSILSPASSERFKFFFRFDSFSFSSLIALAKNSKTILNNSGKTGHICLANDLRGNAFQVFTVGNNAPCGFVVYGLYYIEVVSFYADFLGCFFFLITNRGWILLKAFFASAEMIILFSPCHLLIWCISLFDLHTLKNSCTLTINPTWSWSIILLMCYWILFARILLRNFTSMLISDICM